MKIAMHIYKRLSILTVYILFLSNAALAEDKAIGYIQLPSAKKIITERVGEPTVSIHRNKAEIVYESESSKLELRKFEIFSFPDLESEKIASIDVSGAMLEIQAESSPGRYNFTSEKEFEAFEKGKSKLLVYESKEGWVKVKFLEQPPWNGRYGWIKLSNSSGGFISYIEK